MMMVRVINKETEQITEIKDVVRFEFENQWSNGMWLHITSRDPGDDCSIEFDPKEDIFVVFPW